MQNNQSFQIDVAALQERMGNAFMYVVFVLGDESGDNFRSIAIKTHGADYLRLLWDSKFSINQKYHLAMMARVNMFTQKGAANGFVFERWDDMSETARALIVNDCKKRINQFLKTGEEFRAARDMGFFEFDAGAESLTEGRAVANGDSAASVPASIQSGVAA